MCYLLSTEAQDLGLVLRTDALDRAKTEAKIEGAAVFVRDEISDDLVYSVDPKEVVFWADGSVYFGG